MYARPRTRTLAPTHPDTRTRCSRPPKSVTCPYCGQVVEVVVDPSVHFQEYVEDSEVCCRPITLTVGVEDEEVFVTTRGEDE